MSATTIQIADALVTDLNGHEFSKSFTAVRYYAPVFKLEDMGTLHVTVVPVEFTTEPSDRSRDREEHKIDVAIQQRFEATNGLIPNSSLDGLMSLGEEFRDFLRDHVLTDFANARRVKTECSKPIFDPVLLTKAGVLTIVLTFTYRVVR
jgi:hypothetical protein